MDLNKNSCSNPLRTNKEATYKTHTHNTSGWDQMSRSIRHWSSSHAVAWAVRTIHHARIYTASVDLSVHPTAPGPRYRGRLCLYPIATSALVIGVPAYGATDHCDDVTALAEDLRCKCLQSRGQSTKSSRMRRHPSRHHGL